MDRNQSRSRAIAARSPFRGLATWVLYCMAAPAAALQAISVNSVFAGNPAWGACQAFGLGALVVVVFAFYLAPAASRHRFSSRLLTAFSLFAVLGLVVLQGKANQLSATGAVAARVVFAPTLVVLLVQLGLAVAYLLRSRQEPPRPTRGGPTVPRWVWGSAASFVPLFLIGGFLGSALFGWGPAEPSSTSRHAAQAEGPAQEKFSHFPKPADFEFARETARAGEDFGGQFVHYHTGQHPLIGLSFSNREWHRQTRLSNDLRGIFDPDAPIDAEQYLLADVGYVVVAMQARVDEHVHAVRLQFARLRETGPDLADSYWSVWAGGSDPGSRVMELGGTGARVLGLTGTAGLVVNSLGLLVEKSASADALQTRTVAR